MRRTSALAIVLALAAGGCLDYDSLAGLYHADAGTDLAQSGRDGGSLPIEFVGGVQVAEQMSTTLTLARPPLTQDGDQMLATVYKDGFDINVTPMVDWILIDSNTAAAGWNVFWYQKRAGASEPSSYDFTFPATSDNAGVIVSYRHTSGIDAKKQMQYDSTSYLTPSVVASRPNELLVLLLSSDPASGVNVSWDTPTGMFKRVDAGGRAAVLDEALPVAGESGTRPVMTNFGSSLKAVVEVLLLAPE